MITVCGNKVDRSELKSIHVSHLPNAGRRWKPINHEELASSIEAEFRRREIEITSQVWSVEKNGASLVGGLDVRFPKAYGIPDIPGLNYSFGVSHANDQTRSLRFGVGSRVMVCQNGVVTGLLVLNRKHTTGLDLQQEVSGGIDRYIDESRKVQHIVNEMQERWMSDVRACRALVQAGRRGLLPWSHLRAVDREWRNPRHDEFKPRTAWSLYNALCKAQHKAFYAEPDIM